LCYKGVLGNLIIIWFHLPMYFTVPNKRIHMQCSIPPLQPNKRLGIVISFHLHLFPGIVIPFPNGIDIPWTKRDLSISSIKGLPRIKNNMISSVFFVLKWYLQLLNMNRIISPSIKWVCYKNLRITTNNRCLIR